MGEDVYLRPRRERVGERVDVHVVGVLVGDQDGVDPVQRRPFRVGTRVDDQDPVAFGPHTRVGKLGQPHRRLPCPIRREVVTSLSPVCRNRGRWRTVPPA